MYLKSSQIYGLIVPGAEYIRSLVRQGTISPDAARRLRWFDYYNRCEDARLTCRHFGISPQTFYRWKNRLDPYDLTTLESACSFSGFISSGGSSGKFRWPLSGRHPCFMEYGSRSKSGSILDNPPFRA